MSLNYSVVKQSTVQIGDAHNSPSVTMWPYLVESAQTKFLNRISIYMETGETRERARLLYMNATALEVWKTMKKAAKIVGEVHRPPGTARLIVGLPFSE
ncbi:MAG TPA: hypothetical protein VF214_03470 [Edaphobacter sp.]